MSDEKTGHFHHAGVEDLGSTPQQEGPCLEEKVNSEEWSPAVIQAKTWFYQGSDYGEMSEEYSLGAILKGTPKQKKTKTKTQ